MCIETYIDRGQDGRNWYKDTNEMLKTRFGSDADLAANLLAATSIMASIPANETLFLKAWTILKHDLPIKGFLPVMAMQIEHIKAGREISGRKIRNFTAALKGDLDAVVVDRWMMRAFDRTTEKNKDRPTKKDYDYIEQEIIKLAVGTGDTPSDVQAMIWVGIRKVEQALYAQTRYGSIYQYKLFEN